MLSLFPDLLDYGFYAPLVLRLALASVFIYHGFPKLFGAKEQTVQFFESVGIKPGKFWVLVVGLVEFGGGILLVLGLWVQLVSVLIILDMLVAIWKVKFKMGFGNGWEFDFVLIAMAISLLVLGPGAYSIDLPL
jgi:putative oxidoreductase